MISNYLLNFSKCRSYSNEIGSPPKRPKYSDHTTNLPDEILIHIFGFLPQKHLYRSVRNVCKRWYGLAASPLLWKTIIAENEIPTDILCKWIECSPLLKELCLKERKDLDDITKKVSKFCRKLESLKIINTRRTKKTSLIKSKHLCNLLIKCKYLNNIHFSGVKIQSCKFFKLLSSRKQFGLNRKCQYFGPVNHKQMETLLESIVTSNIYETATLFTPNNRRISLKRYSGLNHNRSYLSVPDTINSIWRGINGIEPDFDDDDDGDDDYIPIMR